MKKLILVVLVLAVLIGGGLFYYKNFFLNKSVSTAVGVDTQAPDRPADLNGYIVSALGNNITVAKEIGKEILSEEDQAAKKEAMQKMSPEERQAARQEESANLTTEDIDLTIPVGVAVVKGSGDASGNVVTTDIADLTKGVYVSIWLDQSGSVQYVKIKGV